MLNAIPPGHKKRYNDLFFRTMKSLGFRKRMEMEYESF
jgi:hypothetical protein